jgi:ankyrin repeat protein
MDMRKKSKKIVKQTSKKERVALATQSAVYKEKILLIMDNMLAGTAAEDVDLTEISRESLDSVICPDGEYQGYNLLALAVRLGCENIVSKLLAKNVNLDATVTKGKELHTSALMLAIIYDKVKTAKLLVEAGANINLVSNLGETALSLTVEFFPQELQKAKVVDDLAKLLILKGANVNFKNKHDVPLIYAAANIGCANICEMLIAKGANIDDLYNDATPLLTAVHSNRKEAVITLLAYGADVNYMSAKYDSSFDSLLDKKDISLLFLSAINGLSHEFVKAGLKELDHHQKQEKYVKILKCLFYNTKQGLLKDNFNSLIMKFDKELRVKLFFSMASVLEAEIVSIDDKIELNMFSILANLYNKCFDVLRGGKELMEMQKHDSKEDDLQDGFVKLIQQIKPSIIFNQEDIHTNLAKVLQIKRAIGAKKTGLEDVNEEYILNEKHAGTALIMAIDSETADSTENVAYVLDCGAAIDQYLTKGKYAGFTPLVYAMVQGKYNVAKYLITKGADLNSSIKSKIFVPYNPIILAFKLGCYDVVDALITKDKFLLEAELASGKTVFNGLANIFDDEDRISYLVNYNFSTHEVAEEKHLNDRSVQMILAIKTFDIERVKELIMRNPRIFNYTVKVGLYKGKTPLQYATELFEDKDFVDVAGIAYATQADVKSFEIIYDLLFQKVSYKGLIEVNNKTIAKLIKKFNIDILERHDFKGKDRSFCDLVIELGNLELFDRLLPFLKEHKDIVLANEHLKEESPFKAAAEKFFEVKQSTNLTNKTLAVEEKPQEGAAKVEEKKQQQAEKEQQALMQKRQKEQEYKLQNKLNAAVRRQKYESQKDQAENLKNQYQLNAAIIELESLLSQQLYKKPDRKRVDALMEKITKIKEKLFLKTPDELRLRTITNIYQGLGKGVIKGKKLQTTSSGKLPAVLNSQDRTEKSATEKVSPEISGGGKAASIGKTGVGISLPETKVRRGAADSVDNIDFIIATLTGYIKEDDEKDDKLGEIAIYFLQGDGLKKLLEKGSGSLVINLLNKLEQEKDCDLKTQILENLAKQKNSLMQEPAYENNCFWAFLSSNISDVERHFDHKLVKRIQQHIAAEHQREVACLNDSLAVLATSLATDENAFHKKGLGESGIMVKTSIVDEYGNRKEEGLLNKGQLESFKQALELIAPSGAAEEDNSKILPLFAVSRKLFLFDHATRNNIVGIYKMEGLLGAEVELAEPQKWQAARIAANKIWHGDGTNGLDKDGQNVAKLEKAKVWLQENQAILCDFVTTLATFMASPKTCILPNRSGSSSPDMMPRCTALPELTPSNVASEDSFASRVRASGDIKPRCTALSELTLNRVSEVSFASRIHTSDLNPNAPKFVSLR